jgi:hypothetical protein
MMFHVAAATTGDGAQQSHDRRLLDVRHSGQRKLSKAGLAATRTQDRQLRSKGLQFGLQFARVQFNSPAFAYPA